MRHSPRLITLYVLLVALLQSPVLVAQTTEVEELTGLARAVVEAHNDVLVSGNTDEALRGRPEREKFRRALEAHVPVIMNRRNAMAGKGMRYTSHRTTLAVQDTKVEGTSATQRAIEHVVLALQTPGGGPPETEYEQMHVFKYVKEADGWRMVSDDIQIPPPLPEEISAPVDVAPMKEAPPGFTPDRSRRGRTPQAGGASQASNVSAFQGEIAYAHQVRPALDIRLAQVTGYNWQAAVNYALTYVFNYNSSYRTYAENDCTNFTSQALRAGGWPYDTTGDRTQPDTWYYGSYTWTTSYSWAAAHNFYLFFKQSGRGRMAAYFSELLEGDIVQADWGPTPDGNISHSMIVTSMSNGTAFVTYHSTDTKNRSLDDLRAQYPGTRWYGLLMYY